MQLSVIAGALSIVASGGVYIFGSRAIFLPGHDLYYVVLSCIFLVGQAVYLFGFIGLSKLHQSTMLWLTACVLICWQAVEIVVVTISYLNSAFDPWQFVPFPLVGFVGVLFGISIVRIAEFGSLRFWAAGAMFVMYLPSFGVFSDSLLLVWFFTAASTLIGTILLLRNPA